ncbi:MAG TPA: ribosome maturation factor RimM [Candidatus Limnocylindrales bacterium]|nr:ribosome maturation factor RimM [Candidatus Limnocylindrales bacterium]
MAPRWPADPIDSGPAEARLVVGLVRGLHGLRGHVRVEVLTDEPGRFEPGSIVHPEGSEAVLTVAEVRSNRPPGLLVRFREVASRDAAEALRDVYLEADVGQAELPEGAYYWHDIVGCRVHTAEGTDLGEVVDVFRVGEAEVYTVRGADGRELLVPAVASVVRQLEPAQKRIVVDGEALGLASSDDGE